MINVPLADITEEFSCSCHARMVPGSYDPAYELKGRTLQSHMSAGPNTAT